MPATPKQSSARSSRLRRADSDRVRRRRARGRVGSRSRIPQTRPARSGWSTMPVSMTAIARPAEPCCSPTRPGVDAGRDRERPLEREQRIVRRELGYMRRTGSAYITAASCCSADASSASTSGARATASEGARRCRPCVRRRPACRQRGETRGERRPVLGDTIGEAHHQLPTGLGVVRILELRLRVRAHLEPRLRPQHRAILAQCLRDTPGDGVVERRGPRKLERAGARRRGEVSVVPAMSSSLRAHRVGQRAAARHGRMEHHAQSRHGLPRARRRDRGGRDERCTRARRKGRAQTSGYSRPWASSFDRSSCRSHGRASDRCKIGATSRRGGLAPMDKGNGPAGVCLFRLAGGVAHERFGGKATAP